MRRAEEDQIRSAAAKKAALQPRLTLAVKRVEQYTALAEAGAGRRARVGASLAARGRAPHRGGRERVGARARGRELLRERKMSSATFAKAKQLFGDKGAMDLVAGVGRVVVVMDHTNKHGDSKVLKQCSLPLTGTGVVDRIITNLGVLDVVEGGLKIVECADGVSSEELRAATQANIVA